MHDDPPEDRPNENEPLPAYWGPWSLAFLAAAALLLLAKMGEDFLSSVGTDIVYPVAGMLAVAGVAVGVFGLVHRWVWRMRQESEDLGGWNAQSTHDHSTSSATSKP